MSTPSWISNNTWIPDGTFLKVSRSSDESIVEGHVVDCRIYKGGEARRINNNHIYYLVSLDIGCSVCFTLNMATGSYVSGDMIIPLFEN